QATAIINRKQRIPIRAVPLRFIPSPSVGAGCSFQIITFEPSILQNTRSVKAFSELMFVFCLPFMYTEKWEEFSGYGFSGPNLPHGCADLCPRKEMSACTNCLPGNRRFWIT